MDIAGEIAINQFGQGVHSTNDFLDQFIKLNEEEKKDRLRELLVPLWEIDPTQADIEQALVDGDLPPDYKPCFSIPKLLKGVRVGFYLNEDAPEKDYKFLLHLFKTAYQRHLALEKDNSDDWHYWDLSDSQIVQDILTINQKRIEEVYSDAGFRNEFATIAKLKHADRLAIEASNKEPSPEIQTRFTFLTYDEVMEKSDCEIGNKNSYSIGLLGGALEKALIKRYKLTPKQIRRLIWDVVERHLQETYKSGLY